MKAETYFSLKELIIKKGFYQDLKIIEECLTNPCSTPGQFAHEYIWVVINSGMKFQIASKIFAKTIEGLDKGIPVKYIYNHRQKVASIEYVYLNREQIFDDYKLADNKIDYLECLPWIGSITKFHLARNLGIDVCKPDRHLVRISKKYNSDPNRLCGHLAKETKDSVGVVDFVLWSSGNLGLL